MKSAKYSNIELLWGIKRICTEKNCFRNAKINKDASDYYHDTMKMVDLELEKSSAPDSDNTDTIVANLLILLSNTAVHFNDVSKKNRKESITLEIMTVDCSEACQFLNESAKLSARYKKAEFKKRWIEQTKSSEFQKILKTLNRVLFVIFIISILIFLSNLFFNQPDQTKDVGIITQIVHWYKYDLRKEAIPISFSEKWIEVAHISGYISMIISGVWISVKVLKAFMKRNLQRIYREWNDYINICNAFEYMSSQLNKQEW